MRSVIAREQAFLAAHPNDERRQPLCQASVAYINTIRMVVGVRSHRVSKIISKEIPNETTVTGESL